MSGYPALFGALGLVFFVFGLLSVLLLVAGAPTDLRVDRRELADRRLLLLGGAVVTNFESLRERMRSGEGRRIGKYGSTAIAQALIVLAIVGALGFLANRYHRKCDASEAKVHSISDQTAEAARGHGAGHPGGRVLRRSSTRPTRARCSTSTSTRARRVKVEYADPNARPDLVEKLGITPEKIGEGLLFVKIGEESVQLEKPDEEKLTNAIVKLTRQSHKKVYFVTGHDERAAEGKGADDKEGFAQRRRRAAQRELPGRELNLETKADVPDDADVGDRRGPDAAAAPRRRRQARSATSRAAARSSRLIDPRAQTDFGDELAKWGVTVGNDAIVDRLQGIFGQAMTPLAGEYGRTTRSPRDMREVTIFPMARQLTVEPEAPASRRSSIVKTGRELVGRARSRSALRRRASPSSARTT